MNNPIKLIFASLFVLLSGCKDQMDYDKPTKESAHNSDSSSKPMQIGATGFVAGHEPNQRPANAPVISELGHNAQWRSHALTGIVEPIPASLDFLDNQGAWYTPFTRPGMLGYYDLRNWHHNASNPNNANP